MNTDPRYWSKALEPVMAINNTMAQCAQEIARCTFALTSDCISMGLRNCQNPWIHKKPEELVQAQMDVSCEAIEKVVKALQKSADTMMQAMTECRGKCADMMAHQCHATEQAAMGTRGAGAHHRKERED
jgi:phasin protein